MGSPVGAGSTTSPATPGTTDHPPRMGFFTDTSVCIGCKACEVACKDVERRPRGRLPADRDVLRQHPGARREHLAARRLRREAVSTPPRRRAGRDHGRPRHAGAARPGDGCRRRGPRRRLGDGRRTLADVVRRLQALHPRRLPGRVPDRFAVPHRVRHGRRPARHLQRLRLLRPGLPLRRDRPPRGGRPGLQVHALLRPAQGGPDAGVRPGLPDRVDPVRRARRAARAGRPPARGAARQGRRRRPALRPRP